MSTDVDNDELLLSDSVPNPVEAHVDGLRFLLFNGVHRYADCSGIVAEEYSGLLGIAHVVQDGTA